jgi:hypothetical protein
MLGCPLENVYNADQTNMYFTLESIYAYADTCSRTFLVIKCNSNQWCTAILVASIKCEKVIPYIASKILVVL